MKYYVWLVTRKGKELISVRNWPHGLKFIKNVVRSEIRRRGVRPDGQEMDCKSIPPRGA